MGVPSAMALKAVLILVSPLTNNTNIQIKEKQPGSSISAIFYNTFYVRQPLGLCILKTRIVAPLVVLMATTGGTAHVETRRSRIAWSPSLTTRSTQPTWRSASSSVISLLPLVPVTGSYMLQQVWMRTATCLDLAWRQWPTT